MQFSVSIRHKSIGNCQKDGQFFKGKMGILIRWLLVDSVSGLGTDTSLPTSINGPKESGVKTITLRLFEAHQT